MKDKMKMGAILLAMMMFVSALFVMASVPIGAQTQMNNQLELLGDGIYTSNYYVGETSQSLQIQIRDIDTGGDMTDFWCNISTTDTDITFTDSTGNQDGDDAGTAPDPYDTNAGTQMLETRDTGAGAEVGYFEFIFDITNDCPIGLHTAQLSMVYLDYTPTTRTLTFNIQIEIESRAAITVNNWFAGDDFKELVVTTTPVVQIENVYMNITRPDADFEWQSATVSTDTGLCWYPGTMTAATAYEMKYRMGVDANKDPGYYDFTYTLEYTLASGERCYEAVNDVEILVDFTPIVEAGGTITIAQGDPTVEFPVTFTNNGNVDLIRVEVKVDPITLGASPRFYDDADDHWEGSVSSMWFDWVPIGDLDIGESADVDLFAALDPYIPPGEHKILLDWQAYYNDEGQTRDATSVDYVKGDWDDTTGPTYDERTTKMTTTAFDVNTHTGAFVVINVTDDELSFTATTADINAAGDVTNKQITVTLTNFEKMKFIGLFAELEVGGDTPFLNPTDHSATTVEMQPLGANDFIDVAGTRDVKFKVDVNAAWWQANSVAPGMHAADVIVDATNDVTKERIEDTSIPVNFEVTGFGAQLYITMVASDEDINPGSEFVLSITITNEGDDVARNIDATLTAEGIEGWEVVDKFVTSIASYATEGNTGTGDASDGWSDGWASVEKFNRTIDIHPKDLAMDDITDIVEGYAYIERTFKPPQAIILSIHTERLGPGEFIELDFQMTSDVNMIEGMLYEQTLELTYYPSATDAGEQEKVQNITIRTTDKGDKYSPTDEVDYSWMVYTLIFVIIAIFCFILGGIIMGKKSEPAPAYEEPYTPYEPEPEPEPAPPMMPEDETPPEPPPE